MATTTILPSDQHKSSSTTIKSSVASEDLSSSLQSPLLSHHGDTTTTTTYDTDTDTLVTLSTSNDEHHHMTSSPPTTSSSSILRRRRRQPSSPSAPLPPPRRRLLDRHGQFSQSKGSYNIRRSTRDMSPSARYGILSLYWHDWWHSLVQLPTIFILPLLGSIYTLAVVTFAGLYLFVSNHGHNSSTEEYYCGMGITNYMQAIYFSLSTMTTIGYGVSDYYFDNCWAPFVIVLLQVFTAIMFDAVAIGLIFQRLSRGRKRGRTVAFSDTACVSRLVEGKKGGGGGDGGAWQLCFRVAELRKYHLVEAHLRVYLVRHVHRRVTRRKSSSSSSRQNGDERDSIVTDHFQTQQLVLQQPSSELGSFLLMALPSLITHIIDDTSPLAPPSSSSTGGGGGWYDKTGHYHTRQDYPTEENYLTAYLQDGDAELIVFVEGTDEMTGSTVQARHSYLWDDLSWNCDFVPCVRLEEEDGYKDGARRSSRQSVCVFDFSKFHAVVPVDNDDDE